MDQADQYLAQKAEIALRRQDRRGYVDAADLTMARALMAKERRLPLLDKASGYYIDGNHHDRAKSRQKFLNLLNSISDDNNLGNEYEDTLFVLRSTRLYPWDIPSENGTNVTPRAQAVIEKLEGISGSHRKTNLAAATVAYRAGLYDAAETHIRAAIRDLRPTSDEMAPFAVAWAHTLLGSKTDRVPEVQPALDSALRVASAKNDTRQVGKIVTLQGVILERLDPEKALKHYVHHADKLSDDFPFEAALLRYRLAPLLSLSEERVQSNLMGNELVDAQTDPRLALRAFMLAQYYEKLSLEQAEAAYSHYTSAMELARRFNQGTVLGWSLLGAFRTSPDVEEQRLFANEAYDTFEILGDVKGLQSAESAIEFFSASQDAF